MTISQGIKYVQRRLLCSTWILRAVTNSIRQPEPVSTYPVTISFANPEEDKETVFKRNTVISCRSVG